MQNSDSARGFIRHQGTGRYYANGRWVETPDSAIRYNSLAEMTGICLQLGLKDVELIVDAHGINRGRMDGSAA